MIVVGGIPPMEMFTDRQIPMLTAMCRSVGLQETVNRLVAWDEDRCRVSPGGRVAAMITNLLIDRQPLYVLDEFFDRVDTEKCFGSGVLPEHLNDSAMGRALDKLADAGPERVYSALVLHVVCKERVAVDTLHADTTSVSVYGEYEPQDDDDPLRIVRGYSKDRRPDLKQFLFGLGTTRDGVPVIGQVRDGNLSDSVWCGELPAQMKQLMSAVEAAGPPPVLVGDSKLVSKGNLERLKDHDQAFISRVPSTFGVVDCLKTRALSKDEWEWVGPLSPQKKAALYRLQSFTDCIDKLKYRFLVVHSSSAEERKGKSIQRRVTRNEEVYAKDLKDLGQRSFACEADAHEAWQAFLKDHREPGLRLSATVVDESRRVPRESPGRPPRDYVPQYETVYHLCPQMERDEETIEDEIACGSCFVLITNLPESEDWPHKRILQEYKDQTVVEQHFAFLKQPKVTGPIYLKNPRRVHALGYVFLMALLVYAVIQRRARNNIKKEGYPIFVTRGVKTDRPTGRRMIQLFANMLTYRTDDGRRHFPTNVRIPRRAFRVLELDPDVYLNPQQPP